MSNKNKQVSKKPERKTARRLKLLLLPSKRNDYRPYLVRRYGLLVIIGLILGLQFGYNFDKTGSVLGRVTTVTTAGLLTSTNDARRDQQLPDLTLNSQLNEAAADKAEDMLRRGYWSHTSPDGTEPWVWIGQAGYNYQEAGENLAKNFSTAGAAVEAWMGSSAHRENLLNAKYKEVGFGVATGEVDGKTTTIIVAFYAAPAETSVAGTSVSRNAGFSNENAELSVAARVGIALQSLTPAAITSLALLFVATTVAITAHFYRAKLPKRLQKTWYKHHGAAKASGLFVVAAFVILLYGGGQI